MRQEPFITTAALGDNNAFEFIYEKNDIRIRITVPENYADYGMFIFSMRVPIEKIDEAVNAIHYLSTLFKNLYFPLNPLDYEDYPEQEIIRRYKELYPYETDIISNKVRIKIS